MKGKCFVIFVILVVGLSITSAQTITLEPTRTPTPTQTITYKPPSLGAEPQTLTYKPPSLASEQPQTIAYKPNQTASPISELANLNFKLGIAYHQALLCQNFTVYNFLVDQYNTWLRQHFGEGADALFMPKITATNLTGVTQEQPLSAQKQLVLPEVSAYGYLTQNPFNSSSDLSKFGKQQVMSAIPLGETRASMGATTADQILRDFLRGP